MYSEKDGKTQMLSLLDNINPDHIKDAKKENFKRAIEITLDEIDELEMFHNEFIAKVSHLEVFKETMESGTKDRMDATFKNLRNLVSNNEPKDHHSEEHMMMRKKARAKLLKRVAIKYLSKSKK